MVDMFSGDQIIMEDKMDWHKYRPKFGDYLTRLTVYGTSLGEKKAFTHTNNGVITRSIVLALLRIVGIEESAMERGDSIILKITPNKKWKKKRSE